MEQWCNKYMSERYSIQASEHGGWDIIDSHPELPDARPPLDRTNWQQYKDDAIEYVEMLNARDARN